MKHQVAGAMEKILNLQMGRTDLCAAAEEDYDL
jgi:hypothetical protein